MKTARAFLSALIVAGCALPARAADDGGRPGAFLDYAASARSLGMGQAFTAVSDDASAVYFNASGLALMRRKNVAAQFSTLLEDSTIGFIGYAHPLASNGGLGVGIVTLGSGDITRRDREGNNTGSYDTASNAAFLSGAFSVSERLAIGSTAKVVREAVADDSDVGFGLDLSAMLSATEKFRLGFSARNLMSPSLKLDRAGEDFPRAFTLGVAYKPTDPFTLGLDIEQPEGGSLKPRVGANYLFNDVLALRAGVNSAEFAVGLGVGIGDWGFDYALGYARSSSEVRDLGSFHRFGFQFNFGLPAPRVAWGQKLPSTPKTPAPQKAAKAKKQRLTKPTKATVKEAPTKETPAAVATTTTTAAKAVSTKEAVSAKGTKDVVPVAAAVGAAAPVAVAAQSRANARNAAALEALDELGDKMDTWDGVPSPELQRQVDTVSRALKKGQYLEPADIYAAQGYVSFFLGEYATSARSLDKASEAAPKEPKYGLRANRARDQIKRAAPAKAAAPRRETAEIKAVREKFEAGDWNGTIVEAQRLLESSPNNKEAEEYQRRALDRLVQPRLRQAKEMVDADRFVEAFVIFQKVLDFDPDNTEAMAYSSRVVQVIEKKADMDSSSRGVGRGEANVWQGISLFQKGLRLYTHGDRDGARAAWDNALLQVKSQPLVYDTVRSTLVELSSAR